MWARIMWNLPQLNSAAWRIWVTATWVRRTAQCIQVHGLLPWIHLGFATAASLAVTLSIGQEIPQANPPITAALTISANHHYFRDGNGKAIVLSGSQTWNTLQDWGTNGTTQPLAFPQFVKFLTDHGHNFTLLWTIETPRFCDLPVSEGAPPQFTVSPFPWKRTGPGKATDGEPKFDLTKFDDSYFSRLRSRVEDRK